MEASPTAAIALPPTYRSFVLSLEARALAGASGRFLAWLLYPAATGLGETVPFDLPFPRHLAERELARIEEEVCLPEAGEGCAPRSLLAFQGPRELGRALFDALFDGPLGDRFRAE